MSLYTCTPAKILVSFVLAAALGMCASGQPDQKIRVGLVQMNGRPYDKEYNLKRAETGIRLAASRGASLLVPTEVAVQGYPRFVYPKGTSAEYPNIAAER